MAAREVVTMHHAASGQTQRASRSAYESVWRAEGWREVSSEEFVPEDVEKPVEKMKVDELKAHAEKRNIDLGEATKKDDILAVILAHNAANVDPGDPAGDGQGED